MILPSVAVLAVYLRCHFGELTRGADVTRDDTRFTLIAPQLTAGAIRTLRVVVILALNTHRAIALLQDVSILALRAKRTGRCGFALLESAELARNTDIRWLSTCRMVLPNLTTSALTGVG